jgi:hypothetical protein
MFLFDFSWFEVPCAAMGVNQLKLYKRNIQLRGWVGTFIPD